MSTNEREDFRMARRPSKEEGRMVYPLLRCGTKPFRGTIILSHDITGCYTHYWCRRTIPCRQENCQPCEKGYAARWHGWVFIKSASSSNRAIFEFTAGASAAMDKYFREHRTLRGAVINAWREPAKPNGRLVLQLSESGVESDSLPKAIKILPILMRMWHARYDPKLDKEQEAAEDFNEQIKLHKRDEREAG